MARTDKDTVESIMETAVSSVDITAIIEFATRMVTDTVGDSSLTDAVLTDIGREFLARNDGSFEVVRFSLGDDEIDYELFDTSAGTLTQDAAVINTPVFEANVNEKIALKFQLLSISNPDLTGPQGVAFDDRGHLFSSSFYLDQIVEFDTTWDYIYTIAGGNLLLFFGIRWRKNCAPNDPDEIKSIHD